MRTKKRLSLFLALILVVSAVAPAFAMLPEYCDHVWDAWVEPLPATCTREGRRYRECTICPAREDESLPPTGVHIVNEWQTNTAATCKDPGSQSGNCIMCGQTQTQSIPATGNHSFGGWQVTTPATCVGAGTETRTCGVCGATESQGIPATGNHSFGGWQVTTPATCASAGSQTRSCGVCGASETQGVPATGNHSFGQYKTTREPTCTDVGTESADCSVCGERNTRFTSRVPHSVTVWEVITAPNGTEKGTREGVCSVCGTTVSESFLYEGTLMEGTDSGDEVENLKEELSLLDYYTGEIDRNYGTDLTAAVAAFQGDHELTATGVADPDTLRVINEQWLIAAEYTDGAYKLGDEAETIADYHLMMNDLGLTDETGTVFTGKTRDAVKGFQQTIGRRATGVLDVTTGKRLNIAWRYRITDDPKYVELPFELPGRFLDPRPGPGLGINRDPGPFNPPETGKTVVLWSMWTSNGNGTHSRYQLGTDPQVTETEDCVFTTVSETGRLIFQECEVCHGERVLHPGKAIPIPLAPLTETKSNGDGTHTVITVKADGTTEEKPGNCSEYYELVIGRPVCSMDGNVIIRCTECGYMTNDYTHLDFSKYPMEHTGINRDANGADCRPDGKQYLTCETCGASVYDSADPNTETHAMPNPNPVLSNCEVTVSHCDYCDRDFEEWTDKECDFPTTYYRTEEELAEYVALTGETGAKDACVAWIKQPCTVCGKEVYQGSMNDYRGHQWGHFNGQIACLSCGKLRPCDHEFDETGLCSKCGMKKSCDAEHVWGPAFSIYRKDMTPGAESDFRAVLQAAGLPTEGYCYTEFRNCTVCGEVEVVSQNTIHTHNRALANGDFACRCGDVQHTNLDRDAKGAPCNSDGMQDLVCLNCGETTRDYADSTTETHPDPKPVLSTCEVNVSHCDFCGKDIDEWTGKECDFPTTYYKTEEELAKYIALTGDTDAKKACYAWTREICTVCHQKAYQNPMEFWMAHQWVTDPDTGKEVCEECHIEK